MSARGESKLELDDRQIDIIFTNRALAQAEKAMGKSVLAVVNSLASGDAGKQNVAIQSLTTYFNQLLAALPANANAGISAGGHGGGAP